MFGQGIVTVRLRLYLVNPVLQFHSLGDIHRLSVHTDFRALRLYREENLSNCIFRNFQITHIEHHFLAALHRYLLHAAHVIVGKHYLIGTLRHREKHVLRDLTDHAVAHFNPAAQQRLLIFQTQISMPSFHIDTVNFMIDSRDRNHILGHDLARFHTSALR